MWGVSRDDDSDFKAGDVPDSVTFGSSRPHRRRWSRRLRHVVAGFVAAGLVAAVVVAAVRQASAPSPRPADAVTLPTSGSTNASAVPSRPVVVTQLGHRVLRVRAGWELFARGPGQLIRIQLAKGRLTRTTIPVLRTTGPVSFLVQPGKVIIRPLDFVPTSCPTGTQPTDCQAFSATADPLSRAQSLVRCGCRPTPATAQR